jgi:hypothetical protein
VPTLLPLLAMPLPTPPPLPATPPLPLVTPPLLLATLPLPVLPMPLPAPPTLLPLVPPTLLRLPAKWPTRPLPLPKKSRSNSGFQLLSTRKARFGGPFSLRQSVFYDNRFASWPGNLVPGVRLGRASCCVHDDSPRIDSTMKHG